MSEKLLDQLGFVITAALPLAFGVFVGIAFSVGASITTRIIYGAIAAASAWMVLSIFWLSLTWLIKSLRK